MSRFNLCGPTYQSLSPVMDAEWAINLCPELIESPDGRSRLALVSTDGLALFAQLPSSVSVPGLFTFAGRSFCVGTVAAGGHLHLYEIGAGGAVTDRGDLGAPTSTAPGIFAANPTQLAVVAGGLGKVFILTLATNALTVVTLPSGNASSIGFLDGFFVALIANSNKFMVSALEDGTVWNNLVGGNTSIISEFPDNVVAMIVSNRRLGFLGQRQSVPYFNAGALFPFIPVPDVLIEEGAVSTYAVSKLDNTVLWIGGNLEQGVGIAYRLNGWIPQRISNHAIETIWQSYATIADAISYTYQSRGHKFWHIYFPTANASWRYDISTQSWHQVGTWNANTGQFTAHRSMCHTFNFGLHLVGDPFSGNIYSMSVANTTDNGVQIRRVRRAPYIAKEHEWVFHSKLEVLAEMGLPSQITAPSTNPGSINLADSSGQLWTVTISDAGAIATVHSAAGQVASPTIILADNVNQSTFWQLRISLTGVVSGLNVGAQSSLLPIPAIYAMGTVPTLPNTMPQDTGLSVSATGVVTAIQPQPHLREPLLFLRWSDDGGHTWSNFYEQGLGLTGNFTKRAIWRRLGRSRNRIYEVSFSDPVSLRIVDGYVNDPDGKDYKPQERLSDQMRKMA